MLHFIITYESTTYKIRTRMQQNPNFIVLVGDNRKVGLIVQNMGCILGSLNAAARARELIPPTQMARGDVT